MGQDAADLVLEAEGELSLAVVALHSRQYDGAAKHLSNALSCHPSLARAYSVLDELAAAAENVDLFPLNEIEPVSAGTVAAQAHLRARRGEHDNAVVLLGSAIAACPDLDWSAVPWFNEPDLAGCLSPAISRAALAVSRAVDEQDWPDRPVTERHDRASDGVHVRMLRLVRRVIARHPYDHELLAAGSALARPLGRCHEAVDWATRAERIEPSKHAALLLALAYGALGQVTDAEAAWLRAISRDASDVRLLHDLADWVASVGRVDDGIRYAERALAVDPEHVHGLVTLHALRYQRDGDVRHLVALAGIARAGTDGGFAEQRLVSACDGAPWLNRIPRPVDATTALIDHLLAGGRDDTESSAARAAVLEPPSALLAVHQRAPDPSQPSSQPQEEPPGEPAPGEAAPHEPAPLDARLPRRSVRYQVWRHVGSAAVPAVGPPSASAAEAVRRLPIRWWPHPLAAYDRGVYLSGLSLDDLLGLLVHPPAPPTGEGGRLLARHEPGLWIRLVQAWTCLGVAHHQVDEPWAKSTRREVLGDLARGPEDWVSEAALFALVATAWVVPRVRRDVVSLVAERIADAAIVLRQREMPIATSLATIALATPDLPENAKRTAQWVLAAADGQMTSVLAATPLEPRWLRMFRRS